MPHVELAPGEVQELRDSLPRLRAEIASAEEDQEAGMDMEATLDRLRRTLRLAEHMLTKYGSAMTEPAVRPRRRKA